MKTASPALIALLNSQNFLMCDLLTITLKNGNVLRYCNYENDIIVGGNTYLSHNLQFDRTKSSTKVGVAVDTMTISLFAVPANTINGVPVMTQFLNGVLDAARVKIDRCFMSAPGNTSAGTVSIFSGRLSTVQVGRSEAVMTVASDVILLNVQMPRNLYQPTCTHTLFDDDMLAAGNPPVGCSLIKASFQSTLVVQTGSTTSSVNITAPTQATGYYDIGYMTFTTGQNTGFNRSIKTYTNGGANGNFILTAPFPYTPAPGDAFNVYPGCDHTQATCTNKFNNVVNFRGFPYVPVPETAV